MARPASIALGGYFPTPVALLPSLASLVEFLPLDYAQHVLVDPCAGDAKAISTLRHLWFPQPGTGDATIFTVELEAERAQAQMNHLVDGFDTPLHCDAFHVEITAEEGASLLFLNPPYDSDKQHRRLEQRFLDRWTQVLVPRHGILMFVVPVYALAASASYLSRHYQDIRAWRFPEPHFEQFRQCVLLARRRNSPVPDNPLDQKRIERWASDATALPELHPLAKPSYRIAAPRPGLCLERVPLDIQGLLAGFRPWHRAAFAGLDRGVKDMIGAKFPVAQPPRPAHIALALAVGTLNGKILTPNTPGLPSILVKGSFERRFETVEHRFNKDGRKVGSVQIQRPRLTLCILRLDTLEFLNLRPGATPSGARDLPDFNTADLVERYGDSLGRLMREQFPALHDPANPAHRLDLPRLARKPLRIQEAAIATGLKLLASGENPQAIAEVGTGKSTVSLSIAGALSPLHFSHTTGELKRLGFDTSNLSPVKRTLIVCPPHLLTSWHDQAAAVLPGHRVVTVESIADLRRDAEIYVMSREVAKLGHAVVGLGHGRTRRTTCPRCGTPPPAGPTVLAETRARCSFVGRFPLNEEARIAEDLATALVSTFPSDPLVRSLLSHHRILAMSLPGRSPEDDDPDDDDSSPASPNAGPPPERLRSLALRLCTLALLTPNLDYNLEEAVLTLAAAAGLHAEIAEQFEAHAKHLDAQVSALEQTTNPSAGSVLSGRRHAQDLLELARSLRESPPPTDPSSLLLPALHSLGPLGRWSTTEPCGEPLFQAVPRPRRFPLARYIMRYCRGLFQLLIVDEWHEYSNRGSAQQKAAHRLVELPGVPTIALTGSLMGGYASSLFANFWALSKTFRKQFEISEQQAFITAYGYRKIFLEETPAQQVFSYGSTTDREHTQEAALIRQMGQAPGVLPLFILKHLLPVALIMHKADLDQELPPCSEIPVPVYVSDEDGPGSQMLGEFRRLLFEIGRRIRADRCTALSGKLWGAMSELPSYLDRCTDDLQPFVLRYPEEVGGAVIAIAKMLPSSWLTPKERWIVNRVRTCFDEGRNVLIFLRHTGGDKSRGLAARYLRLFEEHLHYRGIFLDVDKVKAHEREQWLNEKVIKPKRRILITNPKAVQTGLNNLVHFSRAIWVEGLDFDARVVRQANGRVHRIGQTLDVTIDIPHYANTVQATALDLMALKLTSSIQVDGLSLAGALENAGAGESDLEATQAAMNIGQAIYEAWASKLAA